MRPIFSGILAVCAAFAFSGCSFDEPMSYKKSWELKPGDMVYQGATAMSGKQKIMVSITAKGAPIDIAVVTSEQFEAAKQAMLKGEDLEEMKPLGLFMNMARKDAALPVTVPPGKGYFVIIRNPSKEREDYVQVTLDVRPR
jgi:hypothetical protein